MEGEHRGGVVQVVKGDLGDQGKDQHPQQVLFPVMGPLKALRHLKGKNGESDAAHRRQPHDAGQHRGPQVVAEHEGHGQQFYGQAVQTPLGFCVFHSMFSFAMFFVFFCM